MAQDVNNSGLYAHLCIFLCILFPDPISHGPLPPKPSHCILLFHLQQLGWMFLSLFEWNGYSWLFSLPPCSPSLHPVNHQNPVGIFLSGKIVKDFEMGKKTIRYPCLGYHPQFMWDFPYFWDIYNSENCSTHLVMQLFLVRRNANELYLVECNWLLMPGGYWLVLPLIAKPFQHFTTPSAYI